MAVTVRLFAALREAAGTSQVEVDSATVPQIVADLTARFGEPFATRVTVASGLLDGQPVRLDDEVVAGDESDLALLPPFSGGSAGGSARGSTVAAADGLMAAVLLTGSVLVPVLLGLGAVSDRWAFGLVVLVVGVASLVDLHLIIADAGVRTVLPASLLLAIGPAALILAAPARAGPWTGGVVAVGVIVAFLLAFASPRRRDTADIMSATLLAGLLVGPGTAALLLLYDAVSQQLLIAILALIAVTDATVTFAGRRTPPRVGRLAALGLVVAALTGLAAWAVPGDAGDPAALAGCALAVVLATLVATLLRRRLRSAQSGSAPSGSASSAPQAAATQPRPALLIGTADGVLMSAPLVLVWLQVIGR